MVIHDKSTVIYIREIFKDWSRIRALVIYKGKLVYSSFLLQILLQIWKRYHQRGGKKVGCSFHSVVRRGIFQAARLPPRHFCQHHRLPRFSYPPSSSLFLSSSSFSPSYPSPSSSSPLSLWLSQLFSWTLWNPPYVGDNPPKYFPIYFSRGSLTRSYFLLSIFTSGGSPLGTKAKAWSPSGVRETTSCLLLTLLLDPFHLSLLCSRRDEVLSDVWPFSIQWFLFGDRHYDWTVRCVRRGGWALLLSAFSTLPIATMSSARVGSLILTIL